MNIKYFTEAKDIMEQIAEMLSLNLKKPSDFAIAAEKAEAYILKQRQEAAREYRGEQMMEEARGN